MGRYQFWGGKKLGFGGRGSGLRKGGGEGKKVAVA